MNEINSLDNQIDKLVYRLYSLTPEEIAVVEEKFDTIRLDIK